MHTEQGYEAMKLRFGWGPVDGAAGMQNNLGLVRTVRETVHCDGATSWPTPTIE